MPIRTTDRWRSRPRGSPEQAVAVFRRWGSFPMGDVEDAVEEVYRLCWLIWLDAALLTAHVALETGDATAGKAFLDENWATVDAYRDPRNRYNIAGMGITDTHDLGYRWASGLEAARAFVVHHARYEIPPKDPAWEHLRPYIPLDKRWDAVPAANRGTVLTLADMTGKWWTNRDGHTNLARRGNAIFSDLADQRPADHTPAPSPAPIPPTEAEMAIIRHDIATAPRPLYLPDWITVHVRWVTHPRTTPRIRVPLQTRSTFHDPGNPRTTHWGEWNWLAGGRQGGELGGYNAITGAAASGKGEVIVCQYLNELTWHAGTDAGNRTSWGTEAAYGANMDWSTCFETACAWHGALLEAAGRPLPNALVLHQFWTNKWCPAQVLNRGLVGVMHQKVAHYYGLARQARSGVTVPAPETGTYATPVLPKMADGMPWDGNSDLKTPGGTFEGQRVRAAVVNGPLNKRQWASTQSLLTGPAYETGTEAQLLGWVKGELVGERSEWWVDEHGNRLWAGGFDIEPKTDNAWEELPTETPAGMVAVNGRIYYPLFPDAEHDGDGPPPLGRTIPVYRNGNLHKWAGTTSEVTGTVKAGEEHVFRYWTRGEELPLTLRDGSEATEVIWFAKDLHSGDRMWAGLSEERPD